MPPLDKYNYIISAKRKFAFMIFKSFERIGNIMLNEDYLYTEFGTYTAEQQSRWYKKMRKYFAKYYEKAL